MIDRYPKWTEDMEMKNMLKKQTRAWVMVLAVFSLIIVVFPLLFSQRITGDFKRHMAQQRQNSTS